MTAATVTYFPSSMPNIVYGTATARDTYTLDTGIESNDLMFIASCTTADTVVANTSISAAGVVTLAIHTADAAASGADLTIHWMAIKKPGAV